MYVGFVMLIVTLFPNGQVESFKPISEDLYFTMDQCERDKPNQAMLISGGVKDNQELVCSEVRQNETKLSR